MAPCMKTLRQKTWKPNHDLFYRSPDARTELDIRIVPLEVKAGRGKARSLNAVIADAKILTVTWKMKFTTGNTGVSDYVITFPYFTLFY